MYVSKTGKYSWNTYPLVGFMIAIGTPVKARIEQDYDSPHPNWVYQGFVDNDLVVFGPDQDEVRNEVEAIIDTYYE